MELKTRSLIYSLPLEELQDTDLKSAPIKRKSILL